MEILRFAALERHYGSRRVFAELSGVIRAGDTVCLVGPNGAGKSSLVKILAGCAEPDGGVLSVARGVRAGYLAQDASESDARTLAEAFADALASGRAQEWQMRALLDRFGFAEADLERPLSELSGGQRTRALLARTLLDEPDWLILDEPTNHLDLETTRRLEALIARDPRAALIVSHDRAFVEAVATRIWELADGTLHEYAVTPGRAYTMYLEEREARREQQRRDAAAAAAERARREAVIAELRTHGSHNYAAVRSRERALEKLEQVEGPRAERRAIAVALTAARRATNGIAVEIRGLAKAYAHPLFHGLDAAFRRGERVAVVGPNGAGKSTLLRILAGELAPDRGDVRYGTGLRTASYAQSSVDDLPAGVTAAEAVMHMGVTDEEARGLLGRMNLGGDSGDKAVESFSGGERRRIMLARLMAQHADCLFLDEPTNDLDIASREAVEDVLASYDGALFVVSHDRFLLTRLAERVIAVGDGAARVIDGDYAAFERHARERAATVAAAPKPSAIAERQLVRERRNAHEARLELGRLKRAVLAAERRVADLDAERVEIETRFAAPSTYDDAELVVELQHALERVRANADAAMLDWERAVEAYEAFEAESA